MKKLILALCLLLAASANAATIPEADFTYLGKWELPKREHAGNTGTYGFTQGSMSYVADCMGRPDPSADDGYPGCMLMRGHNQAKGVIGLMDVPAPGGQAVTVIPLWETGIRAFAEANFPDQYTSNLVRAFDVAYEAGPPCSIWIAFLPFYASTRYEDTPFIWKLSCDPANPNPQGGWGLPITRDSYGRNMGHLNKYGRQFELLSAAVCDRLFGIGEECLMLGSGKGAGSRESSAGPAWAGVVKPKLSSVPLFEGFKPAIYYPHPVDGKAGSGRYVRFFEQSAYAYTPYHHCNRAAGGSYVKVFDGREALVQLISEPLPNPPGVYPNTPEGHARYGWVDSNGTEHGDRNTPWATDPVGYYGINACNANSAEKQQPSFWDKKRDGSDADIDCAIKTICPNHATGPRCSLRQFWALLYDPDDISAGAAGTVERWDPQPYGKVLLEGIDPYDCSNDYIGDTSFDGVNLYVSQPLGPDPRIHVYQVAAAGPPPDTNCDVANGDNCQVDPVNCGACPSCPDQPYLSIVQDGNSAVVECVK